MSIVNVFLILVTQERKYKNVAHIAWASAFTMMIVGSLSACFFTLVALLTQDHCELLDYTERNNSTEKVPQIYPTELVPLLNECLFENQSVADLLGLGE